MFLLCNFNLPLTHNISLSLVLMQVIDVTWRYSQDHKETLTRRNEVGESWLVSLWTNMSKEVRSTL